LSTADHLLPFLATALLFAVMPGPAMLYVAAQTTARGRSAGLLAALGLAAGGLAHVVAAVAGLSAVFHTSPMLFLLTKLAGAAYLVWLGIGMLRVGTEPPQGHPAEAPTARRAFADGLMVELLNPKTALFFIAFLPQFLDPTAAWPAWHQLLVLGLVVNLVFLGADLVVLCLADRAATGVRSGGHAARWVRLGSGSMLVGLGVVMAFGSA
jgi:threonine/homoserine/homoserine lactone efflux protein